jgi:Tfp pilus assembly protein PilP
MRSAMSIVLGIMLAAAGIGARAQGKPTSSASATTAQAKATGVAKPPVSQVAAAKPAAKPVKKAAVKKAAVKKAEKSAATPSGAAGAPTDAEVKAARRDPFESLVGRQKSQADAAKNLPPGKAGLQVESLRLDGIVRAPNGMIAVVTNPQMRTYFLREGDQLYDGRVEKIAMDGVSFHELGKDAFGKPVERQVDKRIYSSAGEQQ